MKIATFGSCLAQRTAWRYIELFGGDLVGSVFHNRVDQFVKNHVLVEQEQPSLTLFNRLTFENDEARDDALKIALNQRFDGSLGKHLILKKHPGFMQSVAKGEVDLIILDNFIDICSKLLVPADGGTPIFFNTKKATNWADLYSIDADWLAIDECISHWHQLIVWLQESAPKAKLVFLNFPFGHHPSKAIRDRSLSFAGQFYSSSCASVPLFDIPIPYRDPIITHSTKEMYAAYAAIARYLSFVAPSASGD